MQDFFTLGDDTIDLKTYNAIKLFAEKYAEAKGYKLNPDPVKLDIVLKGLARNQSTHGARYCPCRPLSNDENEDAKKICPCVWHQKEIETDGKCHCELFWRRT